MRQPNHGLEKVKKIAFGSIGLLVTLVSLIWIVSTWKFIQGSEVANGVVSKLNAGGSHPQVDFVTKTGVKVSTPHGGIIFGYSVGDRVSVYYDPKNPRDAVLTTFGAIWGFHLLGLLFGLYLMWAMFSSEKRASSLTF